MGDENKKPDAPSEPQSGFPQKKIVYAVIAVAVMIFAVVLIAKFGYNTDLLNPAGGQMSLVQRPPVTLVRLDVTTSGQQSHLGVAVTTLAVQRVTAGIPRLSPCAVNQSDDCNGACVYLQTDPANCGSCGKVCPGYPHADPGCSGGKCSFICSAGHGDCNQNTADGCETCVKYDHDNCGMCGNHCGVNAFCDYGNCTFVPDQPGMGGLGKNLPHNSLNGDLTEPSCD
jgi:hypothetical protein